MKLVTFLLLLMGGAICSVPAYAAAKVPTKDIEGAADPEEFGRIEGSFIVDFKHSDYDEISIPLAALERVNGKKDGRNNWVFKPKESLDLEGSRTRLVYVMPPDVSPLQVLRNYQKSVVTEGGRTLFECKAAECGGNKNGGLGVGGGYQSLAMNLWSQERVPGIYTFSTASCAQLSRIYDQRYAAMELANGAGYLSIHAYSNEGGTYCGALKGLTIAVVDVMAREVMENSMVVVEPEEMAAAIRDTGSVALYGIYFDTGKAVIKSESGESLQNIAEFMAASPNVKLLVVGHTDNRGEFEINRALSEQRAAEVIRALVDRHSVDEARLLPVGVAFAAPVASNQTEEGRALNRRVQLVEQ